jgi:hypothetical protein
LLFQKRARSAANHNVVAAVSVSSVRIAELASVEIRSIRNAAHRHLRSKAIREAKYDTENRLGKTGLGKNRLGQKGLENKTGSETNTLGK